MISRTLTLFTVVMLATCTGCGTSEGARAALIPVKGKVTYRGKALTQGTVVFEPDGYGRRATGKLQSDGSFVLTTFQEADGVGPGEHKVTVSGVDKSLARDRAFKKYTSRASTRLTAEVSPDHTEFQFDLN